MSKKQTKKLLSELSDSETDTETETETDLDNDESDTDNIESDDETNNEETTDKDIDEYSDSDVETEIENNEETEIEETNNEIENDTETEAETEADTNETEKHTKKIESCFYEYADNKTADDILIDYQDDDIDNNEDNKQIPDDERITKNILTKYEKVRILGTRAKQIALGAKVLIKTNNIKSPYELALLELENNVLPFKIKRPLPNNTYEIWKLSELEKD